MKRESLVKLEKEYTQALGENQAQRWNIMKERLKGNQ
jgi:hypothetical protein